MSEGVEFHMKAPNFNPWILVTNLINRKAGLVRACPCPQTPVPNIWTPGLWPVHCFPHQPGEVSLSPTGKSSTLTCFVTVLWSLKVLQ